MERRWFLKRTNEEYVSYLSQSAEVSPAVAQILINRGIKTPEDVRDFLGPSPARMSDPLGLGGMGEALDAIEGAARRGAMVLVHGDYDADGVTATAIVVDALRKAGIEAGYFIPNRFSDGYGFNPPAVALARRLGAGLIVTVDCGITSHEAIRQAAACGIGVVVTDHHEPEREADGGAALPPEALAVVNPKLSGAPEPCLSGAGVALKLVQGLSERYPGKVSHPDCLDLAAIGTIADSVPLLGENRAIVKEGIRLLERGGRPGVEALKSVSGLDGKRLRSGLLAFTLVPRLNAAGRVSDASEAVELLLTDSARRAEDIALLLDGKNAERQRIEEAMYSEAVEMLDKKGVGPAVVLYSEGWHEGVVGIVASKIAERFSRPAFILSVDGEVARGSARSSAGFDVHRALSGCADLLLSFGGHTQAAGLRLRTPDLGRFEERIREAVDSEALDFTSSLTIDAYVRLKDVGLGLVRELQMLEPFGCGNPQPVLGSKGLEVLNPMVVGNNHLKLKLRSSSRVVDAIGFNMGGLMRMVETSPCVDAAFSAGINEWEGGTSIQLNLKGLRPPGASD